MPNAIPTYSRSLTTTAGRFVSSRQQLRDEGVTASKIDNALKSGRLLLLSKGIYAKADATLEWQDIAAVLPDVLQQPVVVGGLTALALKGIEHYVKLRERETIDLYSPAACPSWLASAFSTYANVELTWHRTGHLWRDGWPTKPFTSELQWRDRSPPLLQSNLEQAFLEALYDVPTQLSFEHAEQLLQGLTQLSPTKLNSLLLECSNVKVKRLFFWFADRLNYPWRKYLNTTDVDLGTGKRVVAKQGKLDSRYQITVPATMFENEHNE